jgi:shikimate dehydrogenase
MTRSFLSKLTGSFAMPAAENPTVAMVEAAHHHGLNIRYINCEVAPENLGDAVKGARAMGWIGFNCSIPHKVAVIDHLDGLGDSAAVMGAVNCAARRGDKFIGENTDGKGFLLSLGDVIDPAGKTIVMLGAGGAARAIGVELAFAGAKRIIVANRSEARGRELVDLLNGKTKTSAELVHWLEPYEVPTETDVVINATSIGLYPNVGARLDLSTETLRRALVVADVIPNPPRTRLIRDAERRGCRVLDGLGMLVNQGVIGVRYWTGVNVDGSVMRRTLETLFSSRVDASG